VKQENTNKFDSLTGIQLLVTKHTGRRTNYGRT